ncbi:MAG TPA: hypothetical protein VID27_01640, partial [Blastocatellia bacterium]
MKLQRHPGLMIVLIAALLYQPLFSKADDQDAPAKPIVGTIPSISGLAWIDGDRFLAIHDAKNPSGNQRPRISIVHLPQSRDGITWEHVDLEWPPPLGPSNDLESIARIPGTRSFLLVESGNRSKDKPRFRRIFNVEFQNDQLKMVSFGELPESVENVEGSAVARIGDHLVFIFAERAEDQPFTDINWADLQLQPLKLGEIHHVRFRPQGFTGLHWRPVSSIEIDNQGRLYVASSFDPGDIGPFRSVIRRIGLVRADGAGRISVALYPKPELLARIDGLKIEGITFREKEDGSCELFGGTDDETF